MVTLSPREVADGLALYKGPYSGEYSEVIHQIPETEITFINLKDVRLASIVVVTGRKHPRELSPSVTVSSSRQSSRFTHATVRKLQFSAVKEDPAEITIERESSSKTKSYLNISFGLMLGQKIGYLWEEKEG